MTRRILLIDADPAFRAALTQQLERYRFEIAAEPDADQALALGTATPPALLVVAVEEPDKAGFKVFQRCKKGALAKVPIVLVTATVSPDSFAKHRSLKVHADEYIDKRSVSGDELLGKIDNLIGLGEFAGPHDGDGLDEIPLSSDDMVLEETVGEDDAEAGSAADREDSMVDAETDAAFAALLGGDSARPSPPEPAPRASAALSDAPRTTDEETSVVFGVPAPIHDTGRPQESGGVEFDTFSREAMRPPVDLIARARQDHHEHDPVAERPGDSVSAIPIDVEDLEPIDEEATAGHHTMPSPVSSVAPSAARSTGRLGAAQSGPFKPKFHDAPTLVETRSQVAAAVAPGFVTGQNPTVPDLGLDEIAASEGASDSSGVFDRRALRKLGELERQIAQLKTELDRARATADASARGANREREFLNLREQITAKDKDLHRVRDELRARDRDLADAKDQLREIEQARSALEVRASELEQRASSDANRAATLEMRDKANAHQLATLHHDLEARTHTANTAEAARVQLERELAVERAGRAASASDAERALRVEREQLIARHQAELGALRNEAAVAREAALHALREELGGEHAAAVAAAVDAVRGELATQANRRVSELEDAHGAELARHKHDHLAALAQVTEERDSAMARIVSERDAAVAALDDEHHQAIARLHGERAAELSQARDDAAVQLSQLRDELTADLAHVKQEADGRIAAITTARDRAVAELVAELERTRHQLGLARTEHEEALGTAAADQAAALEDQATEHAQELAQRDREHAAARARDAEDHDAALAAHRAELEQQAAQHAGKLAAMRGEIADLIEQHENAARQLAEQHRRDVAELAQAQAAELAQTDEDHQRAIEELQRAAAETRAGAERVAAQQRAELEQHIESAARDAAEHRTALLGAKRAIEEAAARHQAEREAAERDAAKLLDDEKAQHERALAVVHGEVVRTKAVADSEHGRAIAALHAEHERQRKETRSEYERQRQQTHAEHERITGELTTERDELRRGLSSARDSLKRSDSELASAVQTIADRNAELRAHAAAIAERDQRIAELRGELEVLEHENTSYQEQVLRAYQKIKADEAMVARAKKAMAIALTVLDDQGNAKIEPT